MTSISTKRQCFSYFYFISLHLEEFIDEKGKESLDPLKEITSCESTRQNTLPQMTQFGGHFLMLQMVLKSKPVENYTHVHTHIHSHTDYFLH